MCLNCSCWCSADKLVVGVCCVGFEEMFKKELNEPSTPKPLMLVSERKSYTSKPNSAVGSGKSSSSHILSGGNVECAKGVCPQLLALILDFLTCGCGFSVFCATIVGWFIHQSSGIAKSPLSLSPQQYPWRLLRRGSLKMDSREVTESVLDFYHTVMICPLLCIPLGSISFDSLWNDEENQKIDAAFLSVLQSLYWIWKSAAHNSKELLPGIVWSCRHSCKGGCGTSDLSLLLPILSLNSFPLFLTVWAVPSAVREWTGAKPGPSWSLGFGLFFLLVRLVQHSTASPDLH